MLLSHQLPQLFPLLRARSLMVSLLPATSSCTWMSPGKQNPLSQICAKVATEGPEEIKWFLLAAKRWGEEGRAGPQAGGSGTPIITGAARQTVWVPQVGSKTLLPTQVPSPRGSDHPSSLLPFPSFILSWKKPVPGKALCLSEKHIL